MNFYDQLCFSLTGFSLDSTFHFQLHATAQRRDFFRLLVYLSPSELYDISNLTFPTFNLSLAPVSYIY
jgi:hypothetical protein